MANVFVEETTLTSIANAIRAKNGSIDTYKPAEMPQAIENIETDSIPQGNLWAELTVMRFNTSISGDVVVDVPDTCTTLTSAFESCTKITTLTLNGNGESIKNLSRLIYLTTMSILYLNISTENVTIFENTFRGNSKLTSIIGELSFKNATNVSNAFLSCSSLVDLQITKETLSKSMIIPSAYLSAESIQSIIDGLTTVETAQTITLNSTVGENLTADQLTQIINKNWSIG